MCNHFKKECVDEIIESIKKTRIPHFEVIYFDSYHSIAKPVSLGYFDCKYDLSDLPKQFADNAEIYYETLSESIRIMYIENIKLGGDAELPDKLTQHIRCNRIECYDEDCCVKLEHTPFNKAFVNNVHPYIIKWLNVIHTRYDGGLIKFYEGLNLDGGYVYIIRDDSRFYKNMVQYHYKATS